VSLKRLAEDLDSLIAQVAKPEPAKTATPNGTGALKVETTKSVDEVVRAAFDYVTSQLKEDDDATTIGEAFMVAAGAVAKDAGLDHDEVQQRAIMFLDAIVESARGTL
jgi:hypothetical protein